MWIMWTVGCRHPNPQKRFSNSDFPLCETKAEAESFEQLYSDQDKQGYYFVYPVKIVSGICELSGEGCAVTDGCELCTFCERIKP